MHEQVTDQLALAAMCAGEPLMHSKEEALGSTMKNSVSCLPVNWQEKAVC